MCQSQEEEPSGVSATNPGLGLRGATSGTKVVDDRSVEVQGAMLAKGGQDSGSAEALPEEQPELREQGERSSARLLTQE